MLPKKLGYDVKHPSKSGCEKKILSIFGIIMKLKKYYKYIKNSRQPVELVVVVTSCTVADPIGASQLAAGCVNNQKWPITVTYHHCHLKSRLN